MERVRKGLFGLKNEEKNNLNVVSVPMSIIEANPEQPRKTFYDEALIELSGSIKVYGVLQPILLRANGKHYSIIAGERRFRAAQMAGLTEIPAIIKDMEDQEVAFIALVENVQREDLNFLEEARGYKKLMDDFGLTQVEIAEKMNKKQSTISNKIRILSLPEDIQEKICENNLTERHARALLRLNDEEDRRKVILRVIVNKLNVKQTEKLVEEIITKNTEKARKINKINYISYKIYVNTLRKAFDQIKEMEKNARFVQEDKGDFLEVKIILPKKDRCFT
ncbi:MAG: ParB/RepB/Spo0J family partition protein [Firmicutes bacterium]|nr:ParB/RepB/Spo0J family partition protein [Bacillota bacterium]